MRLRSSLPWRWLLLGLALVLAAAPAQAQFIGIHNARYDPFFPYYRPSRLRNYALPLVQVRAPASATTVSPAASSQPATTTEIRVSSSFAGSQSRNDAISRALNENKLAIQPQSGPEGQGIPAAVNQPLVLRVGSDPNNPLGKADLSDVLSRSQVDWQYPPENQFQKVHEDSVKAVLILAPKVAGTFTIVAVVVEPIKAPPQPKNEKNEKTAAPAARAPDRLFKRLVTFTIVVDGSVAPPDGPIGRRPETQASNRDEALKNLQIAASSATEKNAAAMDTLRKRLRNFPSLPAGFGTAEVLYGYVNAANLSIPNTANAMKQLLDFDEVHQKSRQQLNNLAQEILARLQ